MPPEKEPENKDDFEVKIVDDDAQISLFDDEPAKPDTQAAEPEKKPRKKADKKADSGDDNIVETLKSRLAAAQKEADERREAEAAEKRRTAELQAELEKVRKAQADSEVEVISSSKAAAQAKAEQLQKELAKAWEDGEYTTAAKLQRDLARAEAILYDLDGQEATYKEKKQAQPEPEKKPAAAPANDLEAWLAGTQLPERARLWFREHPDAFADKEKFFRVQAGHAALDKKGVAFNTDAYYDGLNRYLGYLDDEEKDTDVADDDDDADDEPASRRAAAPVSRGSAPNGQRQVVRAKRAHVEAAEFLEMSLKEYMEWRDNLIKQGLINEND